MPLLGSSKTLALTKERDEARSRAAAADKVVAEAQQKLELAQAMETRRETAHVEQLGRLQTERASLQASVELADERLREAQQTLEARELKLAQHHAEVEAHLETCAKLAAASARADAYSTQLAAVNEQVARQDEQLGRLQPQLAAAQLEVTVRRSELAALEASKQSAVVALQAAAHYRILAARLALTLTTSGQSQSGTLEAAAHHYGRTRQPASKPIPTLS